MAGANNAFIYGVPVIKKKRKRFLLRSVSDIFIIPRYRYSEIPLDSLLFLFLTSRLRSLIFSGDLVEL